MKITEKVEDTIVDEVFNHYANRFFLGQRQELKDALYAIFENLRKES